MTAARGSRQEKVNKSSPALSKAKLGDVVAELVAQVNALTTAHNAMAAKLDADAGVTDTNYTALTGVSATAIKDMESR
jgi:hypothetical protein